MSQLGELFYNVRLKDLTDSDIQKINKKLESLGESIRIDPKALRESINNSLPKGIKIELEGKTTTEALQRAVEGKVVKVEIKPLLTSLRNGLRDATQQSPLEAIIAPNSALLKNTINDVLHRNGYMLNVSSLTGLTKAIKAELNGNRYNVRITCDPTVISHSIRSALMNVESRTFGLTVARDILYRSIDDALRVRPFTVNIQVSQNSARSAVQNALNGAANINSRDALTYKRMQDGAYKAELAELTRLKAANMQAADAAKTHASASINLGGAMGSNIKIAGELGSAMASLYSIHAAKQFLSQVIEIGGELEHQKIALETIYGSESKMESLYSQIKGLARESPFGVMDLTKNIKQLSAYGVEYNEVFDTAKRLADISAATSVDINRLILAFGKTKNRTFLDGLEAKQFAYANIPIYDALSKKLTELEGKFVSVKDVMGRISKREIGFDMVKDILWDMTDEGGKFYNMQEKLAGSVKTSWKLVRDNIELMFGEIAETSIGSSLKSLAEILQTLTRHWKTLGSTLINMVAVWGISKVAIAASNAMMGQHHLAALKEVTVSNAIAVSKIKEAAMYRLTTDAENEQLILKSAMTKLNRSLLLSHKALTEAEWEAAIVLGNVNKDYILRRIALGRLTQAEIDYLVANKMVTASEVQTAMAARASGISLSSLWVIMKAKGVAACHAISVSFTRVKTVMSGWWDALLAFRWSTFTAGLRNVITNIKTAELNVTRLKLAFSGLGKVMKSIGAFMLNPATIAMAAVAGLMYAYEKQSEEAERAKEIGDNLFTKANDGARELKSTLEELKVADGLSDIEVTQGIEKMEQALKDLSPTAMSDINKSLVDQNGNLRGLEERYKVLYERLAELDSAYKNLNKTVGSGGDLMSDRVTGALEATDEGVFNDGIITNAKDYTNALKRRSDRLAEFVTDHEQAMKRAIDAATEADEAFKNRTKGMTTYEDKLKVLSEESDKFVSAMKASRSQVSDGIRNADILFNTKQIDDARKELLSDTDKFIADMNARLKLDKINPLAMTDDQKLQLQIALKSVLDSMEDAGDEAKALMAKKFEEAWEGISLLEDKVGPGLRASMRKLAEQSTDETIKTAVKILRNEGFDALSKEQKEAVQKLSNDARTQVMNELQITNVEMARYLHDNPLKQVITLSFQMGTDNASDLAKDIFKDRGYWNLPNDVENQVKEWTKDNSVAEAKSAMRNAQKKAEKELQEATKAGVGVKRAQDKLALINKSIDYVGWDISETTKSGKGRGSGGSKKDSVAEDFKRRFKDLKDAWSEYQKWSKTIGSDSAATKIAESGLFGDMKAEDIPRTVEEYDKAIEKLKTDLVKVGVKGHSQRESLLNEMLKLLLDVRHTTVQKDIKDALDLVSREFESQINNWNLYEKIRKATGNKDLAYTFSFGLDGGQTDYKSMIISQAEKQFKAIADASKEQAYTFADLERIYKRNPEKWAELPDELTKAWMDANNKLKDYTKQQRETVADMLSEYETVQEKLEKIRYDAQDKVSKVEASNLDNATKAALINRIKTKADYDVFTQSNEYLQFFSGIYALTESEATRIGDLIKQHLDKELQAGTISAKEYYDELEKISEQLEKIRGVRSNLMTYLDGGMDGLISKRKDVNDSKRLQITQKIATLEDKIVKQKASIKGIDDADGYASLMILEAQLKASKEELVVQNKIRDAIIADEKKWKAVASYAKVASQIAQGLADSFGTVRELAESFGVDTDKGAWDDIQTTLDTFVSVTSGVEKTIQSALSGDIGGILSGITSTLLSPITIWNQFHDKKLQKDIDQSKRNFEEYERIIDSVQRRMDNFIGNTRNVKIIDAEDELREYKRIQEEISRIQSKSLVTEADLKQLQRLGKQLNSMSERTRAYSEGGALGYQRQLMKEQLDELYRQRTDMESMKKKDPEALAEINAQIDELEQNIKTFAEEMASTIYGIDIASWTEDIADGLVDAFAKGEDAAEAFDKTVSDIMRGIVTNMISADILAPMFDDVKEYLFGKDGKGGAYGKDFLLQEEEAVKLGEMLTGIKTDGVERSKELYERINELLDGMLSDTKGTSDNLRAGIQSITEEKADLLASYINSIRQYCAQNDMDFDRLLNDSLPRLSVIAEAQLSQLNMIAENTSRSAIATELMVGYAQSLSESVRRATESKDSGFYIR